MKLKQNNLLLNSYITYTTHDVRKNVYNLKYRSFESMNHNFKCLYRRHQIRYIISCQWQFDNDIMIFLDKVQVNLIRLSLWRLEMFNLSWFVQRKMKWSSSFFFFSILHRKFAQMHFKIKINISIEYKINSIDSKMDAIN